MLSKSTETVVKIINYHILSYFLRKSTFREATLGRMFFFCLKSLLFVPRVSLVMSSVTCNSNCILFYIASNVHLVVICGSTNVETPTVEFTIVEVHLGTLFLVWSVVIIFLPWYNKKYNFCTKGQM